MRWRTVILAVVIWCVVEPSVAQSARQWRKWHRHVAGDGQSGAEWTYIGTSDQGDPYLARRLYKDSSGSRLVQRTSNDRVTYDTTHSIQHLDTGEILTFEQDATLKTLTVAFGSQQVVMQLDDLIAYGGPNGSVIPPTIKTAGIALIAGASQQFQAALKQLASIGCYESTELYLTAVLYAHLFYDDVDCKKVPSEKASGPVLIRNFDPYVTPPDAFEQQFGAAYYQ